MSRMKSKKWIVFGAVLVAIVLGCIFTGSAIADVAEYVYYLLQPTELDLSEPGLTNQKDMVMDKFGSKLRIRIQNLYADSSQLSFTLYVGNEKEEWHQTDERWAKISFTDPSGKEIKTTNTSWKYGKDALGKLFSFYSTRFLSQPVPDKIYLTIRVKFMGEKILKNVILVDWTKLEKLVKTIPGSKDLFVVPDGMKVQLDRIELKPGITKVVVKTVPAKTKSQFTLEYEVKDVRGKVVGTHHIAGDQTNTSFYSNQYPENGAYIHEAEFYQFPNSSKYFFHLKGIQYENDLNQTIEIKDVKKEASFALRGGQLVIKKVQQEPDGIRISIDFTSSLPTQFVVIALADSDASVRNLQSTKTKDGKFLYTADVIFHNKVDLTKPLKLKVTNLSQTVPVDWTATFQK